MEIASTSSRCLFKAFPESTLVHPVLSSRWRCRQTPERLFSDCHHGATYALAADDPSNQVDREYEDLRSTRRAAAAPTSGCRAELGEGVGLAGFHEEYPVCSALLPVGVFCEQ